MTFRAAPYTIRRSPRTNLHGVYKDGRAIALAWFDTRREAIQFVFSISKD